MEAFRVIDHVQRSSTKKRRFYYFLTSLAVSVSVVTFSLLLFIFAEKHGGVKKIEMNKSVVAERLLQTTCERNICSTKECIATAARILKFMDPTVDPCDDFYQYACGNYPSYKSIRQEDEVYDLHTEATDNILIMIKRLMDHNVHQNPQVEKASVFYHMCLNNTERKINSSAVFLQFLDDRNLSWPILNEFDDVDVQPWTDTIIEMAKYGFDTLFESTYHASNDNESVVVELECSFPFLPINMLLDPNAKNLDSKYYENLVYIQLFKLGFTKRDAEQVFQDIISVEKEMAQAFLDIDNELKDDCISICTKAWCPDHCKKSSVPVDNTLSEEHHKHQLGKMWSRLLNISESRIEIKSTCKGNLDEVLKVLNNGSKKSVLNYVRWIAVSHMIQYLDEEFIDLYNHYVGKLIQGKHMLHYKWRECADLTRRHMGLIIAKELKDNSELLNLVNHEKEVKKRFMKMKQAFGYIFQIIPWLDNETSNNLAHKIAAMDIQIGYSNFVNDEIINAIYNNFHFNEEDAFFNNMMKLREFNTDHYFRKLTSKFDDDDFRSTSIDHSPLGTNSKYNYIKNRVEIDLGILVPPLFRYNEISPRYLEYGHDVILAGAISHALDTQGIALDASGNILKGDEISPEVRQKYYSFVHCLSNQQFERYHKDTHLPTIDNDIADLGSFFLTLAGLEMHLKNQSSLENDALPGLDFDKHQIYFLQAAQMFCEMRESPPIDLDEKNTRTQKDRVNGAIANLMDFGKHFGCKIASQMDPMHKCNLLTQ